jgi:hypothetical protein
LLRCGRWEKLRQILTEIWEGGEEIKCATQPPTDDEAGMWETEFGVACLRIEITEDCGAAFVSAMQRNISLKSCFGFGQVDDWESEEQRISFADAIERNKKLAAQWAPIAQVARPCSGWTFAQPDGCLLWLDRPDSRPR